MKHLVLLCLFACSNSTPVLVDGGHDQDAAPTDAAFDPDAGTDAGIEEPLDAGPVLSEAEERARRDFVRHLSGRWRATGFDVAQVNASECRWTVELELREDGTMSTHCVEVAPACADRLVTPECLPVGLPGDRFEGRWVVSHRLEEVSGRWLGSIETPARPAPWPASFVLVEDGAILRFWLPPEMRGEARGSYWLERP